VRGSRGRGYKKWALRSGCTAEIRRGGEGTVEIDRSGQEGRRCEEKAVV